MIGEPTKPQPEKSQEGTPTTPPLRAISPEQLREIVEAHRKWVETNEKEGAQALLWGTNLQGANLVNANLRLAILTNANLQEANLYQANLQGANLINANLQRANLFDATLQGALLLGANLQGANLTNANLQEASLVEANLQGADLSNANLQGAVLRNATLQGADLPIVLGLTQEQLDEACGDAETRLPSGLTIDPCRAGRRARPKAVDPPKGGP